MSSVVRKAFSYFFRGVLLLLPLSLLRLGLPVQSSYAQSWRVWTVIWGIYILAAVYYSGRAVGRRIVHRSWRSVVPALLIVALFAMAIAFRVELMAQGAMVILEGMVVVLFLAGVTATAAHSPAPAIVSLLCTVTVFFLAEKFLDALPVDLLVREVVQVPPLAPKDRGNAVFSKNGFRGERPCLNCEREGVRIFTMGGSSTYGTPMHYRTDTYAAYLGRVLSRRRPQDRIEVYNAGIPGYGITQIIDSIQKVVLSYRPDIITVCAWFNDSSATPGWYGYHNRSDREAQEVVELLRRIEQWRTYRVLHRLRSYGLFRFYMLRLQSELRALMAGERKGRHRPRMNPEEFEWGLEQVVDLADTYGFVPVFIYEPTSRTVGFEESLAQNRYYQAMQRVAEKRRVPTVQALDTFSSFRDEWLFYDFIHPNQRGHELLGEALYSTLFQSPRHERLSQLWKERGVDPARPAPERSYFLQYGRRDLAANALQIEARVLDDSDQDYLLELRLNRDTVLVQTGVRSEKRAFTFHVDTESITRPIVDIEVRVRALKEDQLGSDPLQNPPEPFELFEARLVERSGISPARK